MGHNRLSAVEDSDWIHLFESVNKMEGQEGEGEHTWNWSSFTVIVREPREGEWVLEQRSSEWTCWGWGGVGLGEVLFLKVKSDS